MEREYYVPPKQKQHTVTSLTQLVKRNLECLPPIAVVGEISNFKQASSGHWYFSLKDAGAQVRCNMWRSSTGGVRFRPADGTEVLARGNLNVYAPRGEYNLMVDSLEELGKGRSHADFERLKAKLGAEGLFNNKKPLPSLPRKIGIVTSPTGAALRDMLHVIEQRFVAVHILVFPSRVQGENAAREIAMAISWLDRQGHCDLIIAGRGGGSAEDLWAFNEEVVARAIFAATTPIISAVGHEVDFSIADLVADVRAATPSNAAEIAIRNHLEYRQNITVASRTMERAMSRILLRLRNRVNISESHPIFVRVRNRVHDYQRRLAEAEHAMHRLITAELTKRQMRLLAASRGLNSEKLLAWLQALCNRLQQARETIDHCMVKHLEAALNRFATLSYRLEDLSPLKTLNRGYATVYKRNKLVRSAKDVNFGDVIRLRLAKNEILARVIENNPEPVQGSLF